MLKVIQNRISTTAEELLVVERIGFRPDTSTVEVTIAQSRCKWRASSAAPSIHVPPTTTGTIVRRRITD